jgi:hypothetical protein
MKNSHWKVFEKGTKIHTRSRIKVHPSTTYHILLAEIGEPPKKLYALKLNISFQHWLAHLPCSWLSLVGP